MSATRDQHTDLAPHADSLKRTARIVLVGFFVTVSILVPRSLLTQSPKSPQVLVVEEEVTIKNPGAFTTFWPIACAATVTVLLVTVVPVGVRRRNGYDDH